MEDKNKSIELDLQYTINEVSKLALMVNELQRKTECLNNEIIKQLNIGLGKAPSIAFVLACNSLTFYCEALDCFHKK